MKLDRVHILRSLAVLALVAGAVAFAAPAQAQFPLRAPQITVNPGDGAIQGYFNSVGEAINVATDQRDAQTWSTTISGNSTFTFMLEIAGFANQNAIGVYNGGDAVPALYQVFPGAAVAGWYAVASFGSSGSLVVTLFDNNSVFQGQSAYAGVTRNNFGFYIQNSSGTLYSQDYRNGGIAEVLTFAGTGQNLGSWWQCFEDQLNGDRDFNDAIVFVESVNPVPAGKSSWGRIKGLY